MKYGSFSKNGKEFEITNIKTPTPWINYLYNNSYFSTISNNGGGMSYHKNPLHGRITRYRINDVPPDRPGKYIYLKDLDSNEIWSMTWQPVGKNPEGYKAVHGFGYTRIESKLNEIESSVTYFVPLDDNREIWHAKLINKSNKIRRFSLYGYIEFALGHGLIDLINQCDDQHFNRVNFDKKNNSIFATKTYWVTNSNGTQQQENQEWDQWVYFTVNQPVTAYETLRERFLGLNRNENNPESIEKENLSSKDTDFGNAVGALQIDFNLAPNESKDVIFSLGIIDKQRFEQEKSILPTRYYESKDVEQALTSVKDHWDSYFGYCNAETPDDELNTFVNYWIQYQAKVAFDVSRVASFYYWGISRAFGFRDTSQDTIAIVMAEPDKALQRIRFLARQIFSNGRAYHHFYNEGDGELTQHCDDPLWFILAVTDYIKETGNYDILEETAPYADNKKGTILDHLLSVMQFVKANVTERYLPVFGRGDWNDTLDYIGGDKGGESVWGAMFYIAMLNKLIELLIQINDNASEVIKTRNLIIRGVDTHCWDGEWYIRAFGAGNKKIGSKENKYGKIFVNAQSWSVIAGLPDNRRLYSALDSVKKHLDTPYGPKICAPAYREIDPNVGLVTRCVPGKKENGAIFCHTVTWLIQAECLMKRGNQAFEYFKKLLPNHIDTDTFQAEPYVYSQYITSNEHSSPGKASHSWQTGTAAWIFRIFFDYILGVRPTYKGLLIDPVIPSAWKSFKIVRVFRDTKYIIEVLNPNGLEHGVCCMEVDGMKITGNVLPIINKEECKVKIIMANVDGS